MRVAGVYVTQYHETTVAFIQRIAAAEGIWFRFEQKKDGEVVMFGDDPAAYAHNQRRVPLRADAGLESTGAEAITALERHMRRVPEAVRLHEYNHRQAGVSLLVEQNVARDDSTTDAVDYHWGEHYQTPEDGKRIARLRHEAHLAGQLTYTGTGNPFSLEAGEVMLLDRNPPDAPYGLLITSVESEGSRSETFSLRFTAIPADRVWRPKVDPQNQPSIDGILPARITSPGDYQYAYLTKEGWYVVVLPFDLDEWSPGGTSRPVRFAKAYSGDTYGHHFPLIDGAEVALVFTNGDPDRPVIIGAMHDNQFVPGADASSTKTDAVQGYSLAELARDPQRYVAEPHPDPDPGWPVGWWRVDGVNAQGQAIDGWVCDFNFAGGRVTREFAQKWVDFQCIEADHDAAHTIFATSEGWIAWQRPDHPAGSAGRTNLSPLMLGVYDALFKRGDGQRAADELCELSRTTAGGYPWLMQAASRLIVKHESEWANPAKWTQLTAALEQASGEEGHAQHEAELERIEKLVWWDEVKAGVPGFPGPDVFHVNPIGLVANFLGSRQLITLEMVMAAEPANSIAYYRSILPHLNKYAEIYGISKPKRIAHFLSQAAHESHLRASEEGLNYSARQMRKTFGCVGGPAKYNASCDDCTNGRLRSKLWTQEAYYAHHSENLANYVYAGRMGNDENESVGDGYKYRGRGLIQVTGKRGYEKFQEMHNNRSPNDQKDFIGNPDLLLDAEYAVESAFVFWFNSNLNEISDSGTVYDVTQIVNGGQNGYADRLARYNRLAALMGLPME